MSEPDSQSVIIFETNGPVATVTLNRPKMYNALDETLRAELRSIVKTIDDDEGIRVVILKGAGRGFCAGADLAGGLDHPLDAHIEREYKPALAGIADSPKIWIAQVHGSAAGIGAAYAMNCDLLTMAEDASIYMAFAAIALVPDGGNTQLLVQNLGYHRAMETVLEGGKLSARECLACGIANKLFESDDLDQETMAWAKSLASGAPLAMSAAKRLLRKVGQVSYEQAISAEAKEQAALAYSKDFKTGVQAFFDKKKPEFEGR